MEKIIVIKVVSEFVSRSKIFLGSDPRTYTSSGQSTAVPGLKGPTQNQTYMGPVSQKIFSPLVI